MELTEKTVEKKYLYRGRIVNLRCDDALLPDGRACKREVVEHHGGAAVLCVTGGDVLLVRQYRYPYGEELLEIPAGKLEAGEDPLAAAKRELEEETGFRAELVPLTVLYPTPGYSNEKIYIYLAEELSRGVQRLDEGEFLNVVRLPLGEALEKAQSGELRDAKTVAALLLYDRARRKTSP